MTTTIEGRERQVAASRTDIRRATISHLMQSVELLIADWKLARETELRDLADDHNLTESLTESQKELTHMLVKLLPEPDQTEPELTQPELDTINARLTDEHELYLDSPYFPQPELEMS